MPTFYAIRDSEAKGVYDDKELFSEKLKQFPGCSNRMFQDKEKALVWSGVKGLSNEKQQVKRINPLERIIESNKNVGYDNLKITLSNGDTVFVTLDDVYYSNQKFYADNIWFGNRINESNVRRLYPKNGLKMLRSSVLDYLDEQFVTIYFCDLTAPVQKEDPQNYSEINFKHEYHMITINTSQIVSAIGFQAWSLNGYAINDKEVLEFILEQ